MKVIKRLRNHFKPSSSGIVKSRRYAKGKTGCRHCRQASDIQYTYWLATPQTVASHPLAKYSVTSVSPTCLLKPGASVLFGNGQWVHNRSNTPIYATQVMPYTGYTEPAPSPAHRQSDSAARSIPKPPPPPLTTRESGNALRPTRGHRIVPPATRPEAVTFPTLSKEEQDFIDILNDYVAFHNAKDGQTSNHHPLKYIEKPTKKGDDQIIQFIAQIKQALLHYKTTIQSSGLNSYAYDSLCRQLINKYR